LETDTFGGVQTLFPLLRNVLSREYANQSYDVINILAGSLDRSDQVFTVSGPSPA
jgi:hypothetical protein